MTRIRFVIRALTLVGLVAFALVPTACGGSDSDGDSGDNGNAYVTNTGGVAKTDEERELLKANQDLLEAFYAADSAKYCSSLTPEARREAGKSYGYSSCEELAKTVVTEPIDPALIKTKVLDVKVNGDRGSVTMLDSRTKTPVVSKFRKRGDEWLGDVAPKPQQPESGQPSSAPPGAAS